MRRRGEEEGGEGGGATKGRRGGDFADPSTPTKGSRRGASRTLQPRRRGLEGGFADPSASNEGVTKVGFADPATGALKCERFGRTLAVV